MGIQQLTNVMFALLAILNVGTAIKATTAGRIPLNIAAIQGILMKFWKNNATSKMERKAGNAAPREAPIAPLMPFNL